MRAFGTKSSRSRPENGNRGFDLKGNAYSDIRLRIYLNGYINRIWSSDGWLARESSRNIKLILLTGRLRLDFKTIADFRKTNGVALRAAVPASS
jgi:hypothetical protein